MKPTLRLLAFLLTLIVAANSFAQTARVQIDEFAVSRWVTDNRDALKIPAIAVGIVGPQKDYYLEVYGKPELTDAFLIGSLSKSVTALAIMLLVEDGVLTLDAPASKWVPGVPDAVTIEHLLHQVSGLDRADATDAWTDLDATIEDQIADATFDAPGTYAYSNLNYELLGAIIERASSKSYAEFVEQRIFAPLKMTNSTASPQRPDARATGHQYIFGFPQPFGEPQYRASAVPAGFVWMSPQDMARFIRLFVTGGRLDGAQVIPATIIDTLLQKPAATNYAKGWVLTTAHAPLAVALHDGQTAAFSSAMAVVPEREFGVFVLTNVNSWLAMAPMNVLRGLLGSILGGPRVAVTNLEFIGRLIFGFIVALVFLTFLFELVRWIRSGFPVRIYRKELLRALFITAINIAVVAVVVIQFGTSPLALIKTQPDLGYGFLILVGVGTIRAFLTAFNKSAVRTALDAEV